MTELEKFIEIEEEWNKLKAFLEWTQQQEWEFVMEDPNASQYEEGHQSIDYATNDSILAAYFNIDLGQLEYEKEQLWQAQKEQIRRSKKG